jgi:hypothetical protein
MNGLSVAMLGPLDEECHPRGRERSERCHSNPFPRTSQQDA